MESLFFHRSIYGESIVIDNAILVFSLSKGRFDHKEFENQVIEIPRFTSDGNLLNRVPSSTVCTGKRKDGWPHYQ